MPNQAPHTGTVHKIRYPDFFTLSALSISPTDFSKRTKGGFAQSTPLAWTWKAISIILLPTIAEDYAE